jgi:hypothetical protein
LFLAVSGFVFVFVDFVFVSVSVKSYKNKCGTSQFHLFRSVFIPISRDDHTKSGAGLADGRAPRLVRFYPRWCGPPRGVMKVPSQPSMVPSLHIWGTYITPQQFVWRISVSREHIFFENMPWKVY